MKTFLNSLSKHDLTRSSSSTSRGKRAVPQHSNNLGTDSINERLLYLKTQTVIDEFMQILLFFRELEEFGPKDTRVSAQISSILIKLCYGERDHKYTKVVHMLSKYLMGIRKFSLSRDTMGILSYKRLFESVLVAITRELDAIEKEKVY